MEVYEAQRARHAREREQWLAERGRVLAALRDATADVARHRDMSALLKAELRERLNFSGFICLCG